MIGAILRAQFLSMRMIAGRGAIFGVITWVVWYGLWCAAALAACFFAATAGAATLHTYLPIGLLAVCAYWQLIPVLSASMGAGLDMRKLRVYPVPHGKLFLVEVLLRLTTGAEMVLVLAGATIGLLRNHTSGGWIATPRLVPPVLAFMLFNVLLASGMRSLLERLLTRRKVREVLGFFFLMLYVVPRLMIGTGTRLQALGRFAGAVQTVGLPWAAAARASLGESELAAWLSLAGWIVLALWFGRTQFERTFRYDAVAAQATPLPQGASRSQPWKERFYRLPSAALPDPLAAIVEKELRSLFRTPRYRTVFIMGFTFGLAVWLPALVGRRAGHRPGGSQYFLIIVCVYALTLLGQVSYWNCFGFDRSAAWLYFAAPQPLSKTLMGKNLASLFFIYLEVLILAGITAALHLTAGWPKVVETLLVVGVCALYLLGLGNISSVHYPRGMSPDSTSHGGASGRFQGLIFLLYPLALIPVFLAYLARYAFSSEAIFWLALGIAAIAGGIFYWSATQSAVQSALQRRETILQELSKGEGPVAAE